MLAYAFRIKPDGTAPYSAESFDNHTNVLSAILLHCMDSVLKRGLIKYYSDHTECTFTPHGRIDLSNSIKTGAIGKNAPVCNYQLYDEQTYTNQVIKSIIDKICTCSGLNAEICDGLKGISRRMNAVDTIDCSLIKWNNATYLGKDRDYHMALHICRLLVDELIPRKDDDGTALRGFVSEKREHWLFEEFVRGYFEIEHKDIYKTQRILNWGSSAEGDLPDLEMDILLRNKNKTLIIDTKYYSRITDGRFTKKVRSSHLSQLNTYLDSWELDHPMDDLSGMLLYAKTDEVFEEISTILLRHPAYVKILDLSSDWIQIKDKLDQIVDML